MQISKYRMVDAYAATAGTRKTHRADSDVGIVAHNGLKRNKSTLSCVG